jgi:hypothetical protein
MNRGQPLEGEVHLGRSTGRQDGEHGPMIRPVLD